MDIKELNYYYNKFKYGEDIHHTLMQRRVREVLLVSTFYDAFIFEQDGRLSEQIFGEYHQLNLTSAPQITSVPTGEEALRKLDEKDFDLVITMMRIGEISPFELSRRIKEKKSDLPVLLLLNVKSDVNFIQKRMGESHDIDDIFLWNGDSRIFLAMIKYIEDRQNVVHDTQTGLVRVILLVEDNIYFYSRYLPILYREMMLQTQFLIGQALTDVQKKYRMRTRPKILMAHALEDAIAISEKYKDNLLCVISDVQFPHNDQLDKRAGIKLINYLKKEKYDVAMLLQSSDEDLENQADQLDVGFLHKTSETLSNDLKDYIYNNLGFGDFVFRNKAGQEISRVSSLEEFEAKLEEVPKESLVYHGRRNHFSAWLIAHGEIQIAKGIRPLSLEDFDTVGEMRKHLIEVFRKVRHGKHRGSVIDFDKRHIDEEMEIVRLSEGSLGGKGRGIAFLNSLLSTMEFGKKFPDVNIKLPKTAFIGTGEYDLFFANNPIISKRVCGVSDGQIKKEFLKGELSFELKEKLSIYLDHIKAPLAVRSSGLLEDSQSQPFAGIYQTFMLPNNDSDKTVRQLQLEQAIKLVFASTCLEGTRNYIDRVKYKSEEEKMAVIIQEIVGEFSGEHYYPHLSGVAQSYNYYAASKMKHNDGTASIALGLGQWVVDGERSYRFCPKYPEVSPMLPEDLLKHSQSEFFALNMANQKFDLIEGESATLSRLKLEVAEKDGILWQLASVWDAGDRRLRDGLNYYGPRVLTFAHILKYKRFPLAAILREFLELGEIAFGVPVEIEFAINLKKNPAQKELPTFNILQIRPLMVHSERALLNWEDIHKKDLILFTEQGMGNGVVDDIYDIIFIDPESFENTETVAMAEEISILNDEMLAENRNYILIGPGRWGSRDRFLGVPVQWASICNAKIIVETGLEGFVVEPSQGSHFFHNLVAMDAGYFTVPYKSTTEFIDWGWLKSQEPYHKTKYFIHLRQEKSFLVKMFGRKGISVIYK